MDREKQIEEMATVINEMDERNAHYYDKYMIECEAFADANAIAKALYNKGYRKQSEGEWIKSKSGLYVCSECDKTCPYDAQADDISYWECKYCPNCGAKMNGGEQE